MFQSSTFGFAGVFPFKYTSVVLSGQVSGVHGNVVIQYGHCIINSTMLLNCIIFNVNTRTHTCTHTHMPTVQAMAGIFAAVASLISLAAVSNKAVESAYGYFGVALLVVIFCLFSFVLMLKLVSSFV